MLMNYQRFLERFYGDIHVRTATAAALFLLLFPLSRRCIAFVRHAAIGTSDRRVW